MKLNEKLLNLRKQKGLSQQELANQLNVSRQSVSKWELNESEPSLNNIIVLSEIFNVSTDYLLKETENQSNENKTKLSSIFLVIGTLIVLLGALTSYMLYQERKDIISLLIGVIIQIIGCILFEYHALKEQNEKAQKTFLSINIWLIPLIPIKYFSEYTITYSLFINHVIHMNNGIFLTYFPIIISLIMSLILFILIRKVF